MDTDNLVNNGAIASDTIDEGLYSRQLYVLGHDAMTRMAKSHVLILGQGGLGVEIAKNVILAGVKSVTIFDNQLTKLEDLSTQFYLTTEDIGHSRASRSFSKLQSLNQYVPIHVMDQELTEDKLKQYQVVVLTETDLNKQLKINQLARKHNIKFIVADIKGLFGMTFNDLGDEFICNDPTNKQAVSGMVANITNDKEGVVTGLEDSRHDLEDGDYVTFSELKGMDELNECEPRKVKVISPFSFSIGDTTNLSNYNSNGLFTQVKMPKTIKFDSLEKSLKQPEFVISDFGKFDHPSTLHVGFQAIHKFQEQSNGELPRVRNEQDALKVLELAKELSGDEELKESLIKELSYQARGGFAPMAAVMGGIVAQEVLKSVSGKFHPIKQYLYFDAIEVLPQSVELTEDSVQPINSRYDAQIAIFGQQFQKIIANSTHFLVGSGAIGCEMLKNWALLGLGSGENGKIHLTDMDTIEKSNLNRQFLFRPSDVGRMKSETASSAVSVMNPDMKGKVIAYSDRVGSDTENIYDDKFFESLTLVTNALDNVESRAYIDRRCVYYRKPLLESGTLGAMGNTQVVVPHLTESYSSSQDPPETSIPICTLKNFPNKIDHTIQWARDLFEGKFKQPIESAQLYLNNPESFVQSTLSQDTSSKETFQAIKHTLDLNKPSNFEDCVKYARLMFQDLYFNTIAQLLFNFPADSVTSTGIPFWSGPKRTPNPIQFDSNDQLHLEFILATANLHAANFSLSTVTDIEEAKRLVNQVEVPEFQPRSGVKIQVNENEPVANDVDDGMGDSELDQVIQSLPNVDLLKDQIELIPAEFEKDDDKNFHIDFITCASNLRARNYSIGEADRHTTKGIAGKIIPAIATTTTLVSGLICLELLKLLDHQQKPRALDQFKNGFINLATPFIGFSEPIQAPKQKYLEEEFTMWDRFEIDNNLTLKELIEHFKKVHQLEITMVSSGVSMLFNNFMPKAKSKERLNLKISELYEKVTNKPIPNHVHYLTLIAMANDLDGEDIDDIPPIRVNIRN